MVVDHVIMAAGVDVAQAFIDNMTVGGTCADWQALWENTLRVLQKFAEFGFKINLRKCKFCQPAAVVLGLELLRWGYRLSSTFLHSWATVKIPTSLRELQAVLGKFMYASSFIPNCKA